MKLLRRCFGTVSLFDMHGADYGRRRVVGGNSSYIVKRIRSVGRFHRPDTLFHCLGIPTDQVVSIHNKHSISSSAFVLASEHSTLIPESNPSTISAKQWGLYYQDSPALLRLTDPLGISFLNFVSPIPPISSPLFASSLIQKTQLFGVIYMFVLVPWKTSSERFIPLA